MLEVDVRDLVHSPGSARELHLSEVVEGLATELAMVPEEVGAELFAESVVEGLLVSGTVSGVMALSCARCLRGFEAPFEVRVEEPFVPGAGPLDDEYALADGFIDLEPLIRDAVIPAMPFAPLCRPNCRGLCERCGGDRNLGECRCEPRTDPRWAPLMGLPSNLRGDGHANPEA
jgi:uncharacterized protein